MTKHQTTSTIIRDRKEPACSTAVISSPPPQPDIAASLAFRGNLFAQLEKTPPLPDHSLLDKNEDAYWAEMRKQFLIPGRRDLPEQRHRRLQSRAGACAPSSTATTRPRRWTSRIPRTIPSGDTPRGTSFAIPLAAFVGCKRDEIALLRNATEANSYIANGIDMKPGDEVLMTDQEHPGGEHPWDLSAKRYGIVVKKVTLPSPVKDAAQVLNLFNDAITPRTRVMFFSHITTFTGVVLPAKELSALARSKGILSAVDGAHVPGMMRLNLHDIGCDMYSSSPHKWLQAPKGSGFLYVRDEVIDRLWNTIATEGWDDTKIRAERFQRIGSSNVPALWGLRASIKLANDIGIDRIEQPPPPAGRLHARRNEEARRRVVDLARSRAALRHRHRERARRFRAWSWRTGCGRRRRSASAAATRTSCGLSTPYYLQKKDIDRFLAKFDEYKQVNHV